MAVGARSADISARILRVGGDQTRAADLVLPEIERAERLRDEQARRCDEAEARLAEWTAAPEMDAALDYYRELRDHISGRVQQARSARDVNSALRELLKGAWFDVKDYVKNIVDAEGRPLQCAEVTMYARHVGGAYAGHLARVDTSVLLSQRPVWPTPAR